MVSSRVAPRAKDKIARKIDPASVLQPLQVQVKKSVPDVFDFYNLNPIPRAPGKRQPKPRSEITDGELAIKPQATGGTVMGARVSDSSRLVAMVDAVSIGENVFGSPTRHLKEQIREIDGVITPSRTKVIKRNRKTGSPWKLVTNSPGQESFVRSFSAILILGEDSEEAVIKVTVFQSEDSATEVKKEEKISDDIETIRIRLVLPESDTFLIPETKATPAGLKQAAKSIVSSDIRADDEAFLCGETGAHEKSHLAQRRVFGNLAAHPVGKLQQKGKRKRNDDENITESRQRKMAAKANITFPASFAHNSMRTVTVEHRVVFDYIKAGADISYENLVKLFKNVIDREYPQWKIGSNKLKFELVARNPFGPKHVTPAKQLPRISRCLYKFAFGEPKEVKPVAKLDESDGSPVVKKRKCR